MVSSTQKLRLSEKQLSLGHTASKSQSFNFLSEPKPKPHPTSSYFSHLQISQDLTMRNLGRALESARDAVLPPTQMESRQKIALPLRYGASSNCTWVSPGTAYRVSGTRCTEEKKRSNSSLSASTPSQTHHVLCLMSV